MQLTHDIMNLMGIY